MTFTVETGAQVANSNAYVTVAEFRAWHVDRGIAAAANDTGLYGQVLIESGIIKASDYVDKRFGFLFRGRKVSSDQSMEWPRIGAFDNTKFFLATDAIPKLLKNAINEYALIAMRLIDLLPVPAPNFNTIESDGTTTTSTGGALARNREKVGPIEEEQWYHDPRGSESARAASAYNALVSSINLPEYPVADLWLYQLVDLGGSIKLVRA